VPELGCRAPLFDRCYLPAFAVIQREFKSTGLQLHADRLLLACRQELDHGPPCSVLSEQAGILSALLAFGLARSDVRLSHGAVGGLPHSASLQRACRPEVANRGGRAIYSAIALEGAPSPAGRDQTAGAVSMIFSTVNQALGARLGGWWFTLFTWRAIFLTLCAYAVAMASCSVGAACRKNPCSGIQAGTVRG